MYLPNKYSKCYYNIIDRAKSRVLIGYGENHHIIPKSLGGANERSNIVKLSAREHLICHMLLPRMLTGVSKRNMHFALWCMVKMDNSDNKGRLTVTTRQFEHIRKNHAAAVSEIHSGKIVSADTRKKLSLAATGRTGYMAGKNHTEAAKKKMSLAPAGKTITPETVTKILESRKWYKPTAETLVKMGAWVRTAETKKKISDSNKGKAGPDWTDEQRRAWGKNRLGIPQTADHIQSRTLSRKENGHYINRASTLEKMRIACSKRVNMQCHCGKKVSPANFARWHGANCKILPLDHL
jgi:hypothetical protein